MISGGRCVPAGGACVEGWTRGLRYQGVGISEYTREGDRGEPSRKLGRGGSVFENDRQGSQLRVPNLLGNRLFICTFRQIAGLSHAELSNCGKVVLLIVGPLICSEDK